MCPPPICREIFLTSGSGFAYLRDHSMQVLIKILSVAITLAAIHAPTAAPVLPDQDQRGGAAKTLDTLRALFPFGPGLNFGKSAECV